ncbi:MAG: nickel pincer cofactor biosynthesis protein LarC [Phycisphaerales bacterium]|nr:MAG: nickel pincer cofactor biosynthesis protein LarC [Phycisphaerales bacterium]
MRTAFFDCFSGAAGDMIVAALLDAGADAVALRAELASLSVEGYSLSIDKISKQGFAATRFLVDLETQAGQPHRGLTDVTEIINASKLRASVKKDAMRVFERLGKAEAAVHGVSVDEIHFHEVGAIDAIVDVVGALTALDLLGVERVVCSPIPPGSGTVDCAHGTLPVPAPATAELLKGVPIASTDEKGELCTPTGAALLTTLADEFGQLPEMTIRAVGYGAGTREGQTCPNLLRVILGETAGGGDTDQVAVLEANLDDVSPEVVGYCLQRLLSEGALDAYAVPIHMKKSRTGVVLTVLCDSTGVDAMERIIFAETTTFGIRRHVVQRAKLRRRHVTVDTAFGEIRMKVGQRDGADTVAPEYEDCAAAADKHKAPLRTVMAAAVEAWTATRTG